MPISFSKSELGYSSLMLLTTVSWHKDTKVKVSSAGTALAVQGWHSMLPVQEVWVRVSGQWTEIPHATWPKNKISSIIKVSFGNFGKRKYIQGNAQFIIVRAEDMFVSLSSGSQRSMEGGGYLQETLGKVRKVWLLQLRGATDTC